MSRSSAPSPTTQIAAAETSSTLPRPRRAVLAAGLGAVGAAAAGLLGRATPTRAAAGAPLIVGSEANNAGTSDTQLIANSDVICFKLYQQGLGTALMGYVTRTSGDGRGVYGRTDSPNGDGIQARNGATGAGSGAALRAIGINNHGVMATAEGSDAIAVNARQTNTGANGTAILGQSDGPSGIGVMGQAAGTGNGYGVKGQSAGSAGVLGQSTKATGTVFGVIGSAVSTAGRGVYGEAPAGTGSTYGVYGWSASSSGRAVYGSTTAASGSTIGVHGETNSTTGTGVRGHASAASGENYGVIGHTSSASGYGVYSNGRLHVQGSAHVTGTLTKAAGAFRIDHPLDPANKYLQHSFVESDEMKNVYDGTIALDASGRATVDLPDWFGALNRDIRYQLTPIGAPMPRLHVAEELAESAFTIDGGVGGGRVSWQLTGVRADRYAMAHPIEVEVAKADPEAGRYLHPELHGQSADRGMAGPLPPAAA